MQKASSHRLHSTAVERNTSYRPRLLVYISHDRVFNYHPSTITVCSIRPEDEWSRLLHIVGIWFQVLFHSPNRGSFHLSLAVLVHYRLPRSI